MEFSKSIIEGVEIKKCRNNHHEYKAHVHNELSLGYIIEGSTELTLYDRMIHFGTGDGVIIPSLMTHRCVPKDIHHWAYIMLFVDPGYYGDSIHFQQAERMTGDHALRLVEFIGKLLNETNGDTLENILIELLLEFGEKDISELENADTDGRIEIVRNYILSHVRDVVTLDKLQQISGLNKFSLIRNFKKHYIATPAAYHLQYRVAEAKKLLSRGAGVLDICEELKFYDQAHLIREFKKMYGVTPGTYQVQLR